MLQKWKEGFEKILGYFDIWVRGRARLICTLLTAICLIVAQIYTLTKSVTGKISPAFQTKCFSLTYMWIANANFIPWLSLICMWVNILSYHISPHWLFIYIQQWQREAVFFLKRNSRVGDVVFFLNWRVGGGAAGRVVSDLSVTHAEFRVPESFVGTQPSPQLPQKTLGDEWGPGNRNL